MTIICFQSLESIRSNDTGESESDPGDLRLQKNKNKKDERSLTRLHVLYSRP